MLPKLDQDALFSNFYVKMNLRNSFERKIRLSSQLQMTISVSPSSVKLSNLFFSDFKCLFNMLRRRVEKIKGTGTPGVPVLVRQN